MDSPRHRFVKGDIADATVAAPLVRESNIVVHFAAETHVDRSLMAAGEFIQTTSSARSSAGGRARSAGLTRFIQILDRRGVRQRALPVTAAKPTN
jgi:dTDP-glucose 4,6-dehydratase